MQLPSPSPNERPRIAILEFVTGGGMVAVPIREIPTSLQQEGRAMLLALASDWASLSGWDVFICWDSRWGEFEMLNVSVRRLNTDESFLDVWRELANEVDYVVVIAPEMDRQLTQITDVLRTSGAIILNADSAFIEASSDKLLTAYYLELANVAHPNTQRVIDFIQKGYEADLRSDAWTGRSARPTPEFSDLRSDAWSGRSARPTPAVTAASEPWTIKPRDGAGCQEVFRLSSLAEVQQFIRDRTQVGCDWSRYLIQPWIQGIAGSVAVLCGPERWCVLPAMSQSLLVDEHSPQSGVQYRGGEGPFQSNLQALIESFAVRVIRSLPGSPLGWVGIDFVVTDSASLEDSLVAIEVNPRLTTSYLGLREVISENLAELLLQVGLGHNAGFSMSGRSATFDCFGTFGND
jgi:predicted ATP-grasp superfamily ATP-dependent carboligase